MIENVSLCDPNWRCASIAIIQQAHRVESMCNWGRKLVDMCSTKILGVCHVDFLMWIISVDLHVDIK